MKSIQSKLLLGVMSLSVLACDTTGGVYPGELPRVTNPHTEVFVESTDGVSSMSSLTLGSIFLESRVAPVVIDGVTLQASDVSAKDSHMYVSYSSVDTGSAVIKKGAVEHMQTYSCATLLKPGAICLRVASELGFPNADIFSTMSDGTNLYAVGSTSDESQSPKYARLYKLGLNSGAITTLNGTTVLPSYVGTGVWSLGSSVLVTSGTSTDDSKKGGLSVVNSSTMSITASQLLYDARSVGVYSGAPTRAFVTRGKLDGSNPAAVVEYNADGSGSALRTINPGGNQIPESKSSIQVGNQLILMSAGDGGFKILCKATGNTLLTVNAVTVSGIPSARTVTNSVAAAPGFLFAANGEAGLYVYKFEKSSLFNSNYCQGVKATLLGRLGLDSDNSDSTYTSGEISANSVRYQSYLLTKLLTVASGNKGISLVNISGLSVGLSDVDDF